MVKILKRLQVLLLWVVSLSSIVILMVPSLFTYIMFGVQIHERIADVLSDKALEINDSLQD